MPDFNYLNLDLMEKMSHRLAVTFLDKKDEPIPAFSEVNKNTLDSCLNLPKATFNGCELYPNLISKAAILYYAIIKNHPFSNGNKRIATTSMIVFLFINDYWIKAGQNFLYELTIEVAESSTQDMEEVKKIIYQKIESNLIHLTVDASNGRSSGFLFNIKNLRNNFRGVFRRKNK